MGDNIYTIPEDFIKGTKGDINFHFYTTDNSSEKNKVHFTQHLITILLEGHKEVIGNLSSVRYDNSKIMLLQAGNTLMTEKTSGRERYQSILIFFSNDFLFEFAKDHQPKMSKQNEPASLMLVEKDDYLLNFESSLKLLSKRSLTNDYLKRSKLQELLWYLLEKFPQKLSTFVSSCLSKEQHFSFRQTIENHSNGDLTVEELAFLCNMSLSTFKRKFNELYHMTPGRYYKQQKMNKAIALLQNNKRPSEIYFELGYENLSSFSNEFKKYFGVSPKTYIPDS